MKKVKKSFASLLVFLIIMTSMSTAFAATVSRGYIMIDTNSYYMAPNNKYTFKITLVGASADEVTTTSSRPNIATVKEVSRTLVGAKTEIRYTITGVRASKDPVYIISNVKNTHASIRVMVAAGTKQHGAAGRATSYFPITKSVTLDTNSYTFQSVGQTYQFLAKIVNDDDQPGGLYPVAVSSNQDAISVRQVRADTRGYLYEIKVLQPGLSTITVSVGGVSASLSAKAPIGFSLTNDITIPEGYNVQQIAEKFERYNICTIKEFLDAVNSSKFDSYSFIGSIHNASNRFYKLEGYVFPDTYNFYTNNCATAVEKMLDNTENKISELNLNAEAAAKGMTADQIMTLASIIQKESNGEETDMRTISSIVQNRLKDGAAKGAPMLQCDSTSLYPDGYSITPASIHDAILMSQNYYDTYKITGLPAGPICNPGAAAISAALNPAATNCYYFCHDKSGKAYYAETYEQHQANLVAAGLK